MVIFASDAPIGCNLNVSNVGKGNNYFIGYYDTAMRLGMSAFQFQLGSLQNIQRKPVEQTWLDALRGVSECGVHVYSHAPYIHNLAGSKKHLADDSDHPVCVRHRLSLDSLAYELDVLTHFVGAGSTSGVVVHPGSHPDTVNAVRVIGDSINKIASIESTIKPYTKRNLVLENCAGEGTKIPSTYEQTAGIFAHIQDPSWVSVCLDTCHTYAAGLYDLSREDAVDAMFRDFDRVVGQNLALIHLNDSQTEFGSRKDRHSSLGYGHIWEAGMGSLKTLLNICTQRDIPVVLETPTPQQDVVVVHKLMGTAR